MSDKESAYKYLIALETGDPDLQLCNPEDDVVIVKWMLSEIERLTAENKRLREMKDQALVAHYKLVGAYLAHRLALVGAVLKNNEIDHLLEGEDDHAHFYEKMWKVAVVFDDDQSRQSRLEWQKDGLYAEAKDEIRASLRDAMKSRRLGVEQ